MSEFSGPGGNGETRGECSDKDAPVADRWAHMFAKGGELVDQLLALKRSAVDAVGTGLLRPIPCLAGKYREFHRILGPHGWIRPH